MESLSLNDDGRTIELRVGETARIRLPENATTGYRWAPESYDAELVELSPPEPDYPSKAVGSGGEVLFTVKARKPGETELVLKNWREWEGDASVTGRFRLRIVVTP
jgi:inhibitor of cysteine peptidase